MPLRSLLLILCLITHHARSQDTAAILQELAEAYAESKQVLMKPVTELQDLYAGKLEELRKQATAAGQLEEVLAIKSELDSFRSIDTPAAPDSLPKLQQLQRIFRDALPARLQQANTALAPLTASYQTQLQTLQAQLTQQDKLTEALQVKAVLDALNEQITAESATPNTASVAAMQLSPPSAGSKFTQGKLHAIGRLKGLSGPEIDLSAADGITDFIDIMAHSTAWAALRKNGDVIAYAIDGGAVTRQGIVKLVPTRFGTGKNQSIYAINSEGQLVELFSQTVIPTPSPVVSAQVQEVHGIALLADHSVHTWGELYQSITSDRQPMPAPPADALKNAAMVAASRYAAFVVSRTGDLHGWTHSGTLYKIPRELKNITRIWAGAFHVLVEVKGRDLYKFNPEKLNADGCQAVGKTFADIRVADHATLVLHQGKWQPHTESSRFDEAFGERAALDQLQDTSLPFLFQEREQDKLARSALYWLAP
jgi:hypothetical protein